MTVGTAMPQLIGWIFQHSQLGICRVLRQTPTQVGVEFVRGQRQIFTSTAFGCGCWNE